MSLDVIKGKENYQKQLHECKSVIQRKRKNIYGKLLKQFLKTKKKHLHALNFRVMLNYSYGVVYGL